MSGADTAGEYESDDVADVEDGSVEKTYTVRNEVDVVGEIGEVSEVSSDEAYKEKLDYLRKRIREKEPAEIYLQETPEGERLEEDLADVAEEAGAKIKYIAGDEEVEYDPKTFFDERGKYEAAGDRKTIRGAVRNQEKQDERNKEIRAKKEPLGTAVAVKRTLDTGDTKHVKENERYKEKVRKEDEKNRGGGIASRIARKLGALEGAAEGYIVKNTPTPVKTSVKKCGEYVGKFSSSDEKEKGLSTSQEILLEEAENSAYLEKEDEGPAISSPRIKSAKTMVIVDEERGEKLYHALQDEDVTPHYDSITDIGEEPDDTEKSADTSTSTSTSSADAAAD